MSNLIEENCPSCGCHICYNGGDCGEQIERLRAVVDAAKGLNFGEDWNKGTHAEIYRPKLRNALAALEDYDE